MQSLNISVNHSRSLVSENSREIAAIIICNFPNKIIGLVMCIIPLRAFRVNTSAFFSPRMLYIRAGRFRLSLFRFRTLRGGLCALYEYNLIKTAEAL